MKVIFWIFQILLAFIAWISLVYYMTPNHQFQWNIALMVIYLAIQTAAWLGWYLTRKRDDVGKFFRDIVAFDFLAGLIVATIYTAIAGTGTTNWTQVMTDAGIILLSILVFGNAPTAIILAVMGGIPKTKRKKTVQPPTTTFTNK